MASLAHDIGLELGQPGRTMPKWQACSHAAMQDAIGNGAGAEQDQTNLRVFMNFHDCEQVPVT